MKITAEFNSNEELLIFINTFGAKAIGLEPKHGVQAPVEPKKEEPKKEDRPVKNEQHKATEKPKGQPEEEIKQEENPPVNTEKEETKVTMEMVRAVFTKLLQAGKSKEAKDITTKYGAKKLPDLKEEDYAAVLKEAEALL